MPAPGVCRQDAYTTMGSHTRVKPKLVAGTSDMDEFYRLRVVNILDLYRLLLVTSFRLFGDPLQESVRSIPRGGRRLKDPQIGIGGQGIAFHALDRAT